MSSLRLTQIGIGMVSLLLVLAGHPSGPAAQTAFPNTVQLSGFTLGFPDGWSTIRTGSTTILVNVPAGQAATLTAAQFMVTPQIHVSTEQRTDGQDAARRLTEIAAETADAVTSLTIGGWPAIQRRHLAPWPQLGHGSSSDGSMALTITTAVAAGDRIIRLDGSLPSDAPAELAEQVAAIERSLTPSGRSDTERGWAWNTATAQARRLWAVARSLVTDLVSGPGMAEAADAADAPIEADEAPPVSDPADGAASGASSPGAALRILFGGVASEPEVAVSNDGRHVVVAQQLVWITSHDGGLTFPDFGTFPNTTGGDSSVAFGKSGNFYEGTINNNTTAIHISTDNGKTFTFRAAAFTCGAGQCGFNPSIPDQEHIAADRTTTTASGDRVYSAFRNGFATPQWGIVCSTDSGANWSTGNIGIAGDFPRITVATDGSVYVAYVIGANMMLAKFAACSGTADTMPQVAGFPKTVATGIGNLPCPVPGLDRCNNGNTLRSPTVAADDTDATHIYYAYSTNTGSGNENVVVQDSIDAGVTWSAAPPRSVVINGGGTARRFMPWVCATNGTAFVSWYDRRNATSADNDLTDYFGASASRVAGILTAGTEFQINDASTSDTQCEAGQAVGTAKSWPGGSRNANDSGQCSRQPQLGGRCQHSPPNNTDSFQACDLNAATTCPTNESCQTAGGVPKYGDYNGNACAVGHFYTVWASATPARTNGGIDLFFKVRDTVTPTALCHNVTVPTDPNVCRAATISVDNGSTDPDNDTFTLSQTPSGPYVLGTTGVSLTITDQNGQAASCSANVTVVDQQKPNIACPSPVVECAGPSGASVALNPIVSDNCPGVTQVCAPPSGSTFGLGTTPFSCTATDASSNQSTCNSVVKIQDTTPPVISAVSATPNSLWPPNHKFLPVAVAVSVKDTCDPNPVCTVTSIVSNEPPTGGGSGNPSPDFEIAGPLSVSLRAERAGTGSGRVYTITVTCKDHSNNSTQATTAVTVAHDR